MKLLLNYWSKVGILTVLIFSVISCAKNPANQLARELYPKFSHLSAPEHNFEQLWHLFDRHYALFELKDIDWDSVYQAYRPLVTPKTSENELVGYFEQMLNPLKDGHVRLTQADTNIVQLERRVCQFARQFRGRLGEFQQNTFDVLSQNGFAAMVHEIPIPGYQELGFEHLYSYTQSASLGYLRIVDCRDELRNYDQILTELSNAKGLIIDLRYNLGGEVGKEMASRFLQKSKVYGYKKVKKLDGFSAPIPLQAKVAGQSYQKPIVILMNDATFSAAEEFVLVLVKEPHVQIIGSHSGGYFSDAFTYRLPNGIVAALSHEQYLDLDDQLLEDKGIQPHIQLENAIEDLKVNRDPVLEKAIEVLQAEL
ncbi:MAG: S41 family peptidase [Saprospiraceae bacterium]|nr:S41 family peptidase [Saprospiraceae bacterium]